MSKLVKILSIQKRPKPKLIKSRVKSAAEMREALGLKPARAYKIHRLLASARKS